MARRAALDIWRTLGDPLREGENLRWLSRVYWFQGRGAEAEAAATAALDVLETLPPGPELAMTYSTLAQLRMLDHDLDGTLLWGNRAIGLAEQLGETETLIHALANVGAARRFAGDDQGHDDAGTEPAAFPRSRIRRQRLPGTARPGLDDDDGHAARRGRAPSWPPPSPTPPSTTSTSTAGISWRRERHSAPAREGGTRPRRRSVSCSGNRCHRH